MIKMVNEFKLTVVHFARPNPMQICACAWIYRWTEKPWKMRSGLPGLRTAGPPCRRGPRAAGLLLAKPLHKTSDLVISRRCFAYDSKEMDKKKNEKSGESAKLLFLFSKYANFDTSRLVEL